MKILEFLFTARPRMSATSSLFPALKSSLCQTLFIGCCLSGNKRLKISWSRSTSPRIPTPVTLISSRLASSSPSTPPHSRSLVLLHRALPSTEKSFATRVIGSDSCWTARRLLPPRRCCVEWPSSLRARAKPLTSFSTSAKRRAHVAPRAHRCHHSTTPVPQLLLLPATSSPSWLKLHATPLSATFFPASQKPSLHRFHHRSQSTVVPPLHTVAEPESSLPELLPTPASSYVGEPLRHCYPSSTPARA
jgi:hypothetical protein